jgi:hypothetical protein
MAVRLQEIAAHFAAAQEGVDYWSPLAIKGCLQNFYLSAIEL